MSKHQLLAAGALSGLLVVALLTGGRGDDAAPVIALLSLALMIFHHRVQAENYSIPSSESTRSRISSGIQASPSAMKSRDSESSPQSRQ